MQTIYLPPGGKVINVPGVGQTIYLPGNSAGISRAPPTKPAAPGLAPGGSAPPVMIQLPPGGKIPMKRLATPSPAAAGGGAIQGRLVMGLLLNLILYTIQGVNSIAL